MSREDELWAAIIEALKGENVDIPAPVWRREEFLTAILGAAKGVEDVTCPAPVWREEEYLKALFDVLKEGGGGGGGSEYRLLGSKEFQVSTSSTSETVVGTVNAPGAFTADSIIYVKVRDKAGKRNGYWAGGDYFAINSQAKNGVTSLTWTVFGFLQTSVKSDGTFNTVKSVSGLYPGSIAKNGDVTISSKYNTYIIDGTYSVEVYALSWPDNDSPFS